MRDGATVVQGGGARMQNPLFRRGLLVLRGVSVLSDIVQAHDACKHELVRPCMVIVSGVAGHGRDNVEKVHCILIGRNGDMNDNKTS
jgi:hypothetical protein